MNHFHSVPPIQQLHDFLCRSVSGLLLCLCQVVQRDSYRGELDIDIIYTESIGLMTIYIYC